MAVQGEVVAGKIYRSQQFAKGFKAFGVANRGALYVDFHWAVNLGKNDHCAHAGLRPANRLLALQKSGFLPGYRPLHGGNDSLGVEPVFLQQFERLSALAEAVVYGYHLERRRMKTTEDLGDRIAKATVDLVFFAGDGAAGLLYRSKNSFDVQRLYRMNINQFDTDPHFSQRSFCL